MLRLGAGGWFGLDPYRGTSPAKVIAGEQERIDTGWARWLSNPTAEGAANPSR